jgi:aspartyl-tRNA(Asn)/glutamyl-tRNA(Gln) amidotransferase subunit A
MYLADLFTVQANLAGNPAISLPLFETKAGLPIGIQLMGKSFQEQELFNLSQLLVETCSS